VSTRTRIARVVTVGATLGAAIHLYEEPHNPARFYHLVTCALIAFHATSRHARYPKPLNDHEAAVAYLTLPVALATYRYEHNASNGLLALVACVWVITTYLSREVEGP
jgi:hypothetical protein